LSITTTTAENRAREFSTAKVWRRFPLGKKTRRFKSRFRPFLVFSVSADLLTGATKVNRFHELR
jgi:hypothetical protein